MSDCQPAERRAAIAFFLHSECGYRYTDRLQDLTRTERDRLWIGYLIWQRVTSDTESDHADQQGGTAGDHRAFDQFANS